MRKFILIILCAATLLSSFSCVVIDVDETTKSQPGSVNTSGKETSADPIGTGVETIPDITEAPGTTPPVTEPVTEAKTEADTEPKTTEPPVTEAPETMFKTDLSAFEKYMDPADPSEYLILVNPANPMTDHSYKPKDLTKLVKVREGRSSKYMREYAAKAFEAMMKEADANGCKDLSVTSAFRSYSDQESLFQYYVDKFMAKGMSKEEAIAATRVDTAYPGESEHQTGLAVDVHNLSAADQKFADKYEGKWLAENCWKFGFILRYPLGKEDITGYVFEPWHFRFVGRTHAKRIYDLGITLEEYLEKYYKD